MLEKASYEELEDRLRRLEQTEAKLKETEQALHKSNSQLSSIFRAAPIGIGLVSNQTLLNVNDRFCDITGYTKEELIGKNSRMLYPSESEYERVGREKVRIIQKQGTATVETCFKRKNGHIVNVVLSSTPLDPTDLSAGDTFTATDITDRKRAEGALRESEERLRAIFEAATKVSFIITDAKEPVPTILEFSPGAEKIFGYSRAEMLGTPVSVLHLPNDLPKFPAAHKKMREGGIGFSGEVNLVRKSGEKFPALFSTYPLLNEKGDMYAALGVSIDVSEQKTLETKLFQVQKMEAIGNLAGGIAHDFNNLLFPILGLSELLLEDLPVGSIEHNNVQQILKAGKRGADLVKQILTFSRQSEHQIKPVRLQQILKEVLKLARSTIPSNIELIQDVQEDCGLIIADPTQLHQIAMNLITNAYHAVEPTDGKISVKLRETKIMGGDFACNTLETGHYAVLSVSDTGCGIDPEVIDKIFDPYFTTKAQGKGTGLGLAVVYGIVKEYHGDIKVYSEMGKGTTFNVYLPLMERAKQTVPVEKMEVYDTGNERILLVDDEEPIAQLEKQMLERLGYQVTARINSVEALEAFKASPNAFDLVVTDMTMPNMTGDRFSEKLISIRPDIPVIICTGFSEGITQERAAALGIKGFLMKPIIKSEMARTVRRVLDDSNFS